MPLETIVDGLAFPEGLRWYDGALWYSDMHAGEVHRFCESSGDDVVLEVDDAVSGLGWDADGRLLVVSMNRRALLRVERGGEAMVLADLSGYTSHPINDMTVDPAGVAYVGSFGFDLYGGGAVAPTVIIRVAPDGSHSIAAEDLLFPNGMLLADGGGTLIVAETFASRLTAFERDDDGSLAGRRVWADLGNGVSPDGICPDRSGAVWVASPTTREVIRVLEGGEVTDRIPAGERMAVACALGGTGGCSLYVATSSHLSPGGTRKHKSGRIEVTRISRAVAQAVAGVKPSGPLPHG